MRKIIMLATAVALTACSNYQFGDVTKKAVGAAARVIELRREYCATDDPAMRVALVTLIRDIRPNYPEDGICVDLAAAVAEHLSETSDEK